MSFISNAYAATTTAGAGAAAGSMNFMSFLPMIVIFVLFWFLLIRPQQKKAKDHNKMVAELKSGDEIITNSGIIGRINKVAEQFIAVEIANNVVIHLQKNAVSTKVETGTLSKL